MILERLQDVIVAPATPPGRSALAVVRVSGPQAIRLCDQIFQGNKRLSDISGHRLVNGFIMDKQETVDETVAAVFRAPHSYTSEDLVEFTLHGNPLITERVTDLLVSKGARLARPGEFTERAYLHGRLDITQAEAVLAAIEARSMEGIMAAASQLRGDLSTNLNKLEKNLHSLASLLEAQLEFPEEDIPDTEVIPMIEELLVDVEKLEAAFRRGRTQRRGLAVVILGRPNVGKSTLFNALLGQDRSIVTPVPGTTRDLVTEALSFPGGQIKLFDAAGIGIAESLPDQMAVRRAIGAANRADFLIVILDASTGPVPADEELLKLLRTKPGTVVWNKIDTVKRTPELPGLAGAPICISALEGTNIESLMTRLRKEASQHGKTYFANRFQEERLKQVVSKLRSARDAAYMDMRAKDLREALELVSAADHPAITAEILDNIFSRFCVGK